MLQDQVSRVLVTTKLSVPKGESYLLLSKVKMNRYLTHVTMMVMKNSPLMEIKEILWFNASVVLKTIDDSDTIFHALERYAQ